MFTTRTCISALAGLIGFTGSAVWASSTPVAPAAPLTKAETGHYVSPVLVNGHGPYDFVIDTGAEGCAVYQGFAAEHGLKATGTETLVGQTGTVETKLIPLNSLTTAGVSAGPLSCVQLPPRRDGIALAGIIGLDSMASHSVYFSPFSHTLAFYKTGTSPADILGHNYATVTASNKANTLLTFPIHLNGVAGIAVLDSGARRTVINTHFARAAGIDPQKLIPDAPLYGAAGISLELRSGLLGRFTLGEHTFPEVTGTVGDLPVFAAFGVEDQPAMILGLDFLASGAMLVDFPAMKVFIARH